MFPLRVKMMHELALIVFASMAVNFVSGRTTVTTTTKNFDGGFLKTNTCTQSLCCVAPTTVTTTTKPIPSCADIRCPPPTKPKFLPHEAPRVTCGDLCSYALCCVAPTTPSPPPPSTNPCSTAKFTTPPPLLNCSAFSCPSPWYTLRANADMIVCNMHHLHLCSVVSCCKKVPFVTTTIGHPLITCDDVKACSPYQKRRGNIPCGKNCNQKTCCYLPTTTTITSTTTTTVTTCPEEEKVIPPTCANFKCPTTLGYTDVQASRPWFYGPMNNDIAGTGLGGTLGTLDSCKQRCLDEPSCKAIEYSATDKHDDGNNCFIFADTTMTGTQYMTFQVWTLTRKANKTCDLEKGCLVSDCCVPPVAPPPPTLPPTTAPPPMTTITMTPLTCASVFTLNNCPPGWKKKKDYDTILCRTSDPCDASVCGFHECCDPIPTTVTTTATISTCGTFTCPVDYFNVQAPKPIFDGPFNDDIAGTGLGGTLEGSLVHCQQRCVAEPSCKAIQYSATDKHDDGNNCFIFTHTKTTHSQYMTFQIWKLVRQAAAVVQCHAPRWCNVRLCCRRPTPTTSTTATISSIPPTTAPPVTCASILPCPYPKVPINHPATRVCGAQCSYAICCKFPTPKYTCKDFRCPVAYTKVPHAASLDCAPHTICTVQKCCVPPLTSTTPPIDPCSTNPPAPTPKPLTCQSIGECPLPSVRKPGADKLLCGQLCSYAMCCKMLPTSPPTQITTRAPTCASFNCPSGYRTVTNRASTKCPPAEGCSFGSCCLKYTTICTTTSTTIQTTLPPAPTTRPLTCADIHCPGNSNHKHNADMLDCGDLCGPVYCCIKFTTTTTATTTTTTLPTTTTVTTTPVTCSSFTCPGRYSQRPHASKINCPAYKDGGCSIKRCCDRILTTTTTLTAYPITCVHVLPCPLPLLPIDNPEKVKCGTSWKVTGHCNYLTCCKTIPPTAAPSTTLTTTVTTLPPTTTPFTCRGFQCPSPVFVPFAAPLAEKIPCTGKHSCTISMCCLRVPTTTVLTTTTTITPTNPCSTVTVTTINVKVFTCGDVVCPKPMTAKKSVAKMPCGDTHCGYHTCCVMPTPPPPPVTQPPMTNPCTTATVITYECSGSFTCPHGYLSKSGRIECPPLKHGGCSIDLCCDLVPPTIVPTTTSTTTPITCSSILPCPKGWTTKQDAKDKVCASRKDHACSWVQCCDKPPTITAPPATTPTPPPPKTTQTTTLYTCLSFTCPTPVFVKKPSAGNIVCKGPAGCSVFTCCNLKPIFPPKTTTTKKPKPLTCASILPCQKPMQAKPHADKIFCHTSCSNAQCCMWPPVVVPSTQAPSTTTTFCSTTLKPFTCKNFTCPPGYDRDHRDIYCKPYQEGGCSIGLCCKPSATSTTTMPPPTTTITTPRTCLSITCPAPMKERPHAGSIPCGNTCSFLECCNMPSTTSVTVATTRHTATTTTTTPYTCFGFKCPAPHFIHKNKPPQKSIVCDGPEGCSIPLCCSPVIPTTPYVTTTTTTPISCVNILPCPLPLVPKNHPAKILCGDQCNFLTCCLLPTTTTEPPTTMSPTNPCITLIPAPIVYFCDEYLCPIGYEHDPNAKHIRCPQQHGCSMTHCCMLSPTVMPPTTITTTMRLSCASIFCAPPMKPKADADKIYCGKKHFATWNCDHKHCCDMPTTSTLPPASTRRPGTTISTTTTLYMCDSFQCPTPSYFKKYKAVWDGPYKLDIPGTGKGGSVGDLNHCKQRCLNDPSCAAIEYSATSKHTDGNNCFIFDNAIMNGKQYMTFETYTLIREAKRIWCTPPLSCTIQLCCDRVTTTPPTTTPRPNSCADFKCKSPGLKKLDSSNIQCVLPPARLFGTASDNNGGLVQKVGKATDAGAVSMISFGAVVALGALAAAASVSLAVYGRSRRRSTRTMQFGEAYSYVGEGLLAEGDVPSGAVHNESYSFVCEEDRLLE